MLWGSGARVRLRREDLAVATVVGSDPVEGELHDTSLSYVATREDGVALLFGRDFEGGVFRPEGGGFLRTLRLPDGRPRAAPAEGYWHHQYTVAWHPDGRPTAVGTEGGRTLSIQVGTRFLDVDTGYLSAPHASYRGDELVIARPMDTPSSIGGRLLTNDRWDGVLLALDGRTFEPRWVQGLALPYGEQAVHPTTDRTLAVVGSRPNPGIDPGMRLAFYE